MSGVSDKKAHHNHIRSFGNKNCNFCGGSQKTRKVGERTNETGGGGQLNPRRFMISCL